MSTQSEDTVTIEVDGQTLEARKGAMLIEVTDAAGISIPRFCYHKKLSVAANCRMCLVEVEKAPKPLPACATPVTDGMKVFTRSEYARSAQKAVMEFLLINHPLDCPICDQGGECELQDLALGYGGDVSRFTEKKRVVRDRYIGPLIATDMTRCIHCTRCIRLLQEVAGKMELGATGRGEKMEIGNYIENSLESELSGNVIDVCPVGALTSKPFRFKARAWELTRHASVAPHDSMGSNIFVHARRGKVMRVVPRENEAINEVWLSDRDRFSYEGLYSEDRLTTPMVKVDGSWQSVDWGTALQAVVDGITGARDAHGADALGMLVAPTATLEEMLLAQALARGLGIHNIDHRLRQADFTGQDGAPLCPSLGQSLAVLEANRAALVIGSNTRKEQPIAAHRLRKAALSGASIMFVNPVDYEFHFPVHARAIVPPSRMADVLAGIARTLLDQAGGSAPAAIQAVIEAARPDATQLAIAAVLRETEGSTVLLGNAAVSHPQYSLLRTLASVISEHSGSVLGLLPEAANSVGGWLAGALPHRGPAGNAAAAAGLTAKDMIDAPRKGYFLLGVEPDYDCWDTAAAKAAIEGAEFVVSASPFASETLKSLADVLLPISPFTETSGTFVSAAGQWQSFAGVTRPLGESRPGWKVLRVLGNLFELEGFDYTSSEQVRDELRDQLGEVALDNRYDAGPVAAAPDTTGLERIGDVPIHSLDALVRRAASLQQTPDASNMAARVCRVQAGLSNIGAAEKVRVVQGGNSATLDLIIDERVPEGCVWVPCSIPASTGLGGPFGPLSIEQA